MIGALVLFVHVISAMGMFAALGVEVALQAQLGRARSVPEVRAGLDGFRWVRGIGGPSLAGAVLGIVFLMTVKPDLIGSIIAMGGAIALGLLADLPGYQRSKVTA
jgi:hypothetical protein